MPPLLADGGDSGSAGSTPLRSDPELARWPSAATPRAPARAPAARAGEPRATGVASAWPTASATGPSSVVGAAGRARPSPPRGGAATRPRGMQSGAPSRRSRSCPARMHARNTPDKTTALAVRPPPADAAAAVVRRPGALPPRCRGRQRRRRGARPTLAPSPPPWYPKHRSDAWGRVPEPGMPWWPRPQHHRRLTPRPPPPPPPAPGACSACQELGAPPASRLAVACESPRGPLPAPRTGQPWHAQPGPTSWP